MITRSQLILLFNTKECGYEVKKITITAIDGICFDYGTVKKILFQGHPKTVFCKISVRRSKFCVEFSLLEDG